MRDVFRVVLMAIMLFIALLLYAILLVAELPLAVVGYVASLCSKRAASVVAGILDVGIVSRTYGLLLFSILPESRKTPFCPFSTEALIFPE